MRKPLFGILVLGGFLGALATIAVDEGNKFTSTEAFCVSCHSMGAYVADERTYQTAPHQNSSSGIRAVCADCHLPDSNIVSETWAHASAGVKDVIAQIVNDYENPAVWNAERARMAFAVRDRMKANDSAVCRNCHDDALIAPVSAKGRLAHEEIVKTKEKTCIQCHFNLVHAPVKPRLEFIRSRNHGG